MKRGGKILSGVAMTALAACGTQPKLQVRAIPAPASATQKPVPIRIAEAHAQFALGNVALALESYRKAAREDPSSTDALLGIAACYDKMGRFDLSRRNYEMALAIAPADPRLLGALAASLDLQGKHAEASSVRSEIAVRLAAKSAPQPVVAPAPVEVVPKAPVKVAAAPAPEAVQVAQARPAAAPAAPAPVVRTNLPTPDLAAPQPQLAATDLRPIRASLEPLAGEPVEVRIAEAAAPVVPAVAERVAQPEVGHSVTVKLPPPRPVIAGPAPADPPPVPEPESQALPARLVDAAPEPELRSGPRIERLSMGVVALVTGGDPIWKPTTVAQSDRSATVRFVPLHEANARARRVKVRVLNAARVDRLAARTRSWLTDRGWSRMPIGDAPEVRSRSVIVYPAGQRALAQNLANQFGFEIEERADAKFVTMLLGRDAARIEVLRPRNA